MSIWMDHMRAGDFAAAWEVSDQVLRSRHGMPPCFHLPRHMQSVWRGQPLHEQRVLLRCYHGLGDTVQFIRYAPLVRAVAAEVTVWAQPELIPLLRTAPGVDRLLPLHDGQPGLDYDVDVEIMELPHVFRSTIPDLPVSVPYLQASSGAPLGSTGHGGRQPLNVGVVWQAGGWDERRSVSPVLLLPQLASVPGVILHCLQRGPAAAAWRADFGPNAGSNHALELAGTMQALDLIVSVDSFPAHLAGALARPVWNLLCARADWRWLEGRDDSPWYPTMRLFRQPGPGEWEPVVARVAAELRRITRSLGAW